MSEETNPFQSPSADDVYRPDISTESESVGMYGPLRSIERLGKAVRILLALNAVLMILAGLFDAWLGSQFAQGLNPLYSDIDDAETAGYFAYMGMVGAVAVVYIVTGITFLFWTNRAMKNAWALSVGMKPPELSPRAAVGWYFCPFLNLFKPFQGMNGIWQSTFCTAETATRLRWWWGFWLLSNFTGRITARLPADTYEQLAISSIIDAVVSPLPVVAAVLLIAIVGPVTERQEADFQESLR